MKRPPSTLLFALFVLPLLLGGVSPAVAADPGLEPQSYIRSVNPGAVRNDFDGFLGMAFTVGEEPLTVTRLGRMMLEGNSGTHQVKLVRHSDGLDVVGGSVEVSMAGGTPGQFVHVDLAEPLILESNTVYYLVSEEVASGDTWMDAATTILATSGVASLDLAVFGTPWQGGGLANHSYIPVDFVYLGEPVPVPPSVVLSRPLDGATFLVGGDILIETVVGGPIAQVEFFNGATKVGQDTSAPFQFLLANPGEGVHELSARAMDGGGTTVTSAVARVIVAYTNGLNGHEAYVTDLLPGALRNDFSGWMGMKITVGPEPMLVSELGRLIVAGNSGSHVLKLIRALDLVEVPGGETTLGTSGATPGEFAYAPLAAPVALEAGTMYYVVSQEVAGGDQWHGLDSSLNTTSRALMNGPVFGTDLLTWTVTDFENHAFGPVDLKYLVEQEPVPPSVMITAPLNAASFLEPDLIEVEVSTSAGVVLAEFYAGVLKLGERTGASPYQFSWTNPPLGSHALTVRATDGLGLVSTSAVVQVVIGSTNGLDASGEFVATVSPGTLRDDFSGFLGMALRVGGDPLVVTELGRWVVEGNSRSHLLKIVRAGDELDLPGGSVTVSTAGAGAGGFVYGTLAQPVILEANSSYFLVSEEAEGLDQWHELDTEVVPGDAGIIEGPVFYNQIYPWTRVETGNRSFIPVDLRYQRLPVLPEPAVSIEQPVDGATIVGPVDVLIETDVNAEVSSVEFFEGANKIGEALSAPFQLLWTPSRAGSFELTARAAGQSGQVVTSAISHLSLIWTNALGGERSLVADRTLAVGRNDFEGFVGMQITVGNSPLVVTELGRVFVAGNSNSHLVKLVRESDGQDVPGGSVTVGGAGGTDGEMEFGALSQLIVLEANTSYYVVSEEHTGGDRWFEADVLPTPVASVDGPVFATGGTGWTVVGQPNRGFVPVDIRYLAEPELRVSISNLTEGEGFVLPGSVMVEASVTGGVPAERVAFYRDSVLLGEDLSEPYGVEWVDPAPGVHSITAVAVGGGTSVTSLVVNVSILVTNLTARERVFLETVVPGVFRNDYEGMLGMKIAVGSDPLVVTELGRWVVEGNSEDHVVRVIRAEDGWEVGSVTLSLAGVAGGQFLYGRPERAIVLAAHTGYYVVSEERNGGDEWHQLDSVAIPGPAGVVEGAVFGDGVGPWTLGTEPDRSFGPVNFRFVTAGEEIRPALNVLMGGGQVRLRLHGQDGVTYVIQATTNLLTWLDLGTQTVVGESVLFDAPSSGSSPVKFYRALVQE